jgi:hypothetical protein
MPVFNKRIENLKPDMTQRIETHGECEKSQNVATVFGGIRTENLSRTASERWTSPRRGK